MKKTVNFFWPSLGWGRYFRYVGHRVGRIPGTPYSIACGFACGAAVSFTPIMGLHIAVGAALAYVLRGNMLAAAIGTIVGNPWTFPFIWLWIYWLGNVFLGSNAEPIDFSILMNLELKELFGFLYDNFWNIFLPMLLGGIPTALTMWALHYYPLRYLIKRYQENRQHRRAQRSEERLRLLEHQAANENIKQRGERIL